jgi:hypothetical protein
MGDFETLSFTNDFRELLADFEIPVESYQRLELVFRQVLSRCPATQYDFQVDTNEDFGFGRCQLHVARGRAKARDLYRQALTTFNALFESAPLHDERGHLEDQWLRNLAHTLRFHVSLDSQVPVSESDDHSCYLAISEAIFRPFFERHFENRLHTSEKYHEFLALKRMMESGTALNFQKLETSRLPMKAVQREVERMNLLPLNWLDEVVSNRDKTAA